MSNMSTLQVQNVITMLGLRECKDVYVGDAVVRGISGGQKRRVTAGEMLVCPRPVCFYCMSHNCGNFFVSPVTGEDHGLCD